MPSRNRNLLLFYFAFVLAILFAFRFTHVGALLFLPLITGILICSRFSLVTGLCVFLLYLSVEGALKLMSGYSLPLRLGPDLMIIALLFQTLRLGSLHPQKPRLFSAPFAVFFIIHVLWALVEFCNPYSIGFDSSLAGYKVYVSSLLLYFIAYKAVEKEEDLNQFSWCILGILTTQVVMAAYQFQIGEAGLIKWSSLYSAALGVQFHGLFFRPFGFSNVPGGASTFIYILAPLSVNLLIRQKKLWSLLFCTFLLGAMGYVLFISQIRAALIKCALGLADAHRKKCHAPKQN